MFETEYVWGVAIDSDVVDLGLEADDYLLLSVGRDNAVEDGLEAAVDYEGVVDEEGVGVDGEGQSGGELLQQTDAYGHIEVGGQY